MPWYISHRSQLEFWREASAKDALAGKKTRALKLPARPADARELRRENPWGLSTPLHVLVGSANARKVASSLCCHMCSGQLPPGSFIDGGSGALISSPELCFLQMASELSFVDLVVLGFEFCGSYRLDKKREPIKGFHNDQPLTSVAQLSLYLEKAAALKGSLSARRAVRFIADGSASPMETVLTLLLTLPYKMGGYGLLMPLLNHTIEVRASARRASGKKRFRCDLYWPDRQVDVEYDSDAFHAEARQAAKDSDRRLILSSMGISVIPVSREKIMNAAGMHEIAIVLAELLHKRLQYPKREFLTRRYALRHHLLPVGESAFWE